MLTIYRSLLSLFSVVLILLSLGSCEKSLSASSLERNLSQIKLPRGFSIEIFASGVAGARSLSRGAKGTIFVGSRKKDKVYALVDSNGDGKSDKQFIVASGLNSPNGVAFRDGSLFIAEINRILRLDNIENRLANPPAPVVVYDKYPTDRHHGWKFIRFGPDGYLYVPVGAPCNICLRKDDKRYASITRIKPDGSAHKIVAHGVRNSVGFDWHPETKELWFTDNGRDMLGDDIPPCELNRLSEVGQHFGYPFCHGKDIPDPEFGFPGACSQYQSPAQELGPHVAPLGMRFYTGKLFPKDYHNQIFIAEHGSWNRSVPIGYRITLVKHRNSKAVTYEVFAEGWLQGNGRLGRPVDILNMPDGSILVSDDYADAVYRITYNRFSA